MPGAIPRARTSPIGRLRLLTTSLLSGGILMPLPAFAADGIDSGDTAWILASTALVLFMTIPGLALFYAGLVRTNVTLSHSEWPADVNYEYLGAIFPVKRLGGSIGIQFGALYTDINETTELQPFGTGQSFTYTDFVGGLTYARRY